MKEDITGSTRSMKSHLQTHNITEDSELDLKNQTSLTAFFKKSKVEAVDTLNIHTLKTAITYFIAECDLPYSIVNKPSFRQLLVLANPRVNGMLVQRHAIAQHCRKVYDNFDKYIKNVCFSEASYVAFTQDAWTSPNNCGFLGITSHYISKDWKLMDVVIGMPQIEGLSYLTNFAFFF